MSAEDFAPWPVVKVDEYGQMTCPVPRCDAELYLERIYAIPLVAEQAASGDHDPEAAVSNSWRVQCTNGHQVHDYVDQIREINANGGDHEGDLLDETCDEAPEYDHFLTHQRINSILFGSHR